MRFGDRQAKPTPGYSACSLNCCRHGEDECLGLSQEWRGGVLVRLCGGTVCTRSRFFLVQCALLRFEQLYLRTTNDCTQHYMITMHDAARLRQQCFSCYTHSRRYELQSLTEKTLDANMSHLRAFYLHTGPSLVLTNDDIAGPSPFGSTSSAVSIRASHPFTARCAEAMAVTGHARQASDRCSVVRAATPAPTAIPAELRCAAGLLSSPTPSGTRGKSRSFSRMGGISRHSLFSSSRSRGRGLQRWPLLLLLLLRAFPKLKRDGGFGRAARGSEERGGCVLSSGRGRDPPVREPPQDSWLGLAGSTLARLLFTSSLLASLAPTESLVCCAKKM